MFAVLFDSVNRAVGYRETASIQISVIGWRSNKKKIANK